MLRPWRLGARLLSILHPETRPHLPRRQPLDAHSLRTRRLTTPDGDSAGRQTEAQRQQPAQRDVSATVDWRRAQTDVQDAGRVHADNLVAVGARRHTNAE